MLNRWTTSLLAASAVCGACAQSASEPPPILVYSKWGNIKLASCTLGYRHASIPAAVSAIRSIGQNTSLFTPTFSEDENLFTDAQLEPFKAIVFLSNSEEVLTQDGQEAFKQWLTKGGSLVGLHAGTACLFNDTAFGTAMGSWFDYHPEISNATFLKVMDHETIDMLPDRYTTYEEVHHFRSDPRDINCTVLLTYDPTSFSDPQAGTRPYYQGTPPPSAWFREGQSVDLTNGTEGLSPATMTGRTWFTSLGHEVETWSNPTHLAHVEAGLRWALAEFNANSTSSPSSSSATSTSAGTSTAASSSASAPASTAGSGGGNGAVSTTASVPVALGLLLAAAGVLAA
ncbi:hypothetical protein JCM6882_001934 [Rhodosporidiobolus microsporus]